MFTTKFGTNGEKFSFDDSLEANSVNQCRVVVENTIHSAKLAVGVLGGTVDLYTQRYADELVRCAQLANLVHKQRHESAFVPGAPEPTAADFISREEVARLRALGQTVLIREAKLLFRQLYDNGIVPARDMDNMSITERNRVIAFTSRPVDAESCSARAGSGAVRMSVDDAKAAIARGVNLSEDEKKLFAKSPQLTPIYDKYKRIIGGFMAVSASRAASMMNKAKSVMEAALGRTPPVSTREQRAGIRAETPGIQEFLRRNPELEHVLCA